MEPRAPEAWRASARGPLVAAIFAALALCMRSVSWMFSVASSVFDHLSGADGRKNALPTLFVNACVLNREQKLAEMAGSVKAEVAQKVQALGPFANFAADLAGKAAAGLTAMAVSDRDVGESIGHMISESIPLLLHHVGVYAEARVVYAEGQLAVVQVRMVKVDLPVLLNTLTSKSSLGVSVGRAWGWCWDACEIVGLGAFFERATTARIGELIRFSLVQSLSAQLEQVVQEQMGGLEVAITTLPSEAEAEHFFAARQRLEILKP